MTVRPFSVEDMAGAVRWVGRILSKNLRRIRKVATGAVDAVRYLLGLGRPLEVGPSGGRATVLFVGDFLGPRLSRLAKWVARSGRFRCVLLTQTLYDDFEGDVFDEVHLYRSRFDLRCKLRGLTGVNIVHAFAPTNRSIHTVLESVNIPFVLDVKDLYVTNYGLSPPILYMKLDLPSEKKCLEGADGIVSQSQEVHYARKIYRIPKVPSLFFPLYCDDDSLVEPERLFDPDDIHIAYAGGIYGTDADPGHFGNMQFFGLAETLKEQRLHLHVYPSPNVRQEVRDEYEALQQRNSYFHLHASVRAFELSQTLGQYHFGILPFFNSGTDRDVAKRIYSTSLKLFNFIEAGLPVLISADLKFQSWLARRYGAAIEIKESSLHRLSEIVTGIDYGELTGKLVRNRKRALLSHNIPRLVDFYKRVETAKLGTEPGSE